MIKQKTKKEPKEVKSKDGVIRRNLDTIRVSAATPLPTVFIFKGFNLQAVLLPLGLALHLAGWTRPITY